MTENVTPAARTHVNPQGLHERVLLEAELRRCHDWPNAPYYTEFIGQSTLQRTFVVNGGHTPAVALVVGAVMALESGAEMHFDSGGACLFLLGANVPPNGYIKFGVANFHYDPIIQVHG